MATLGIAVIGQCPRDDIAATFAEILPVGVRIVLRGCLAGLSDEAIDRLTPRDGDDTLYTRLRGERDVKISKQAVIAHAPATLDALRQDGADVLLFACTGEFPKMRGDAGVIFPSRVLAALAAAFLTEGRLGLLVPAPEQISKLTHKWKRSGVDVIAEALIPSADIAAVTDAAKRLVARRPNLIAMDCMSYRPESRTVVHEIASVPTLLAVSATARVVEELLA
jgi:protein AroM